jgi:hypothetical protein
MIRRNHRTHIQLDRRCLPLHREAPHIISGCLGLSDARSEPSVLVRTAALPSRSSVCRVLIVLTAGLLFCCFPKPAAAQRSSEQSLELLQRNHAELHQAFAKSLAEIAEYCDGKGFDEPAARIRKLAVPLDVRVLRIEALPMGRQPELPGDLPPDERYWQVQLRHHQKKYATDLYLLSRRALKAGHPSYAYHLIREVARHDPDHSQARRLLGFVQFGGEWVTPFTRENLRKRHVRHEQFGWLPQVHVERYENDERYFKGRWISREQEAEIRRDFKNAWEIRTDHYLIKTNVSLERGVELGDALEDFHQFFVQTFAGFFNTPAQMQRLFEGGVGSQRSPKVAQPYVIHFYRTKDEYVARLKSRIPVIEETNGLYLTDERVAHFFQNSDPNVNSETTLFHEASHQLFFESHPQLRPIAEKANFWITEGIACYLESFRRENGRSSVGDPRYTWFEAARFRYLVDGYYVPLAQFASMGLQEFQYNRNMRRNYSQASGLVHFFMHYQGGIYRDALIEHLSQLYSPNARLRETPASLAELTGVSFDELDRQYGQYVRSVEQSLADEDVTTDR